MRKLIITLFTCACLQSLAQINLSSNGDIPNEIFSSTTNKYAIKKQQTIDSSFYEPRDVRLKRIRFYEKSYYLIDAIKNNANIYINDSYTKLLNQIADDLLKNEPELRSNIYLYAYKAPYVNAFSTDQGDLFFTVGLLAQVNNEAELAFVVGHEIMHYIKQHNVQNFNERIKVSRGEGAYQGLSIDKGMEQIHSFSRELEKEADILSLNFYLESDYSSTAVSSALNMLRTSHLGYQEIAFNYNDIFSRNFTFPAKLLPDSIPQMEDDSTDDALSTHPNVTARIAYCKEYISDAKKGGDKLYKFMTKDEFHELQAIARKEQLIQLYNNSYFAKGIYNASILLDQGIDDSLWYEDYIYKSFKSAIRDRINGSYSDENELDTYTGELFRVHHMLYRLKHKEIASLWFINEFDRYRRDSSDLNKARVEEALKAMMKTMKSTWKRYESDDFDTAVVKNRSMNHMLPDLRKIFKSSSFTNNFKDIKTYYNEMKREDKEDDEYDMLVEALLDDINKPQVDKLIVFNPYYMRLDETVEGYLDYERSYDNEPGLLDAIDDASNANGVETVMLDVRRLEKEDAEKFDEISLLNAYIGQMLKNGIDGKQEMMTVTQDRLDEIRAKYGTDFMMWVGVRSFKGTQSRNKSNMLLSLVVLNYLPYSLISTFEKNHEVEMFYVLIDLKSNKAVRSDYFDLHYMKDNQNLLTIYLNEFFKEIN